MGIPTADIEKILNCLEEERFQDARDLLDESIGKDINNHNLYYLKAIVCIQMNKLDEALIDLGEVAYLNPNHLPSMHALAYLFLKRGDFESAVNKWIGITTLFPTDILAKQHLKLVKEKKLVKNPLNQYNSSDFIILDYKSLKKGMAFNFDIDEENHQQLVPTSASITKTPLIIQEIVNQLEKGHYETKSSWWKRLHLRSFLLLFFFCGCLIFSTSLILKIIHEKKSFSENLSAFHRFLTHSSIQFVYTDEEIQKQKTLILSLVRSNRFNQAKLEINKIYLSNASVKDKQIVHMWESMLVVPTKSSDIDLNISLQEAFKNPALFQGLYVAFQGVIDHFENHETFLTFTLTTSNKTVIPIVSMDTTSSFENRDTVQLFGKMSQNTHTHQLVVEAYALSLTSNGLE